MIGHSEQIPVTPSAENTWSGDARWRASAKRC